MTASFLKQASTLFKNIPQMQIFKSNCTTKAKKQEKHLSDVHMNNMSRFNTVLNKLKITQLHSQQSGRHNVT